MARVASTLVIELPQWVADEAAGLPVPPDVVEEIRRNFSRLDVAKAKEDLEFLLCAEKMANPRLPDPERLAIASRLAEANEYMRLKERRHEGANGEPVRVPVAGQAYLLAALEAEREQDALTITVGPRQRRRIPGPIKPTRLRFSYRAQWIRAQARREYEDLVDPHHRERHRRADGHRYRLQKQAKALAEHEGIPLDDAMTLIRQQQAGKAGASARPMLFSEMDAAITDKIVLKDGDPKRIGFQDLLPDRTDEHVFAIGIGEGYSGPRDMKRLEGILGALTWPQRMVVERVLAGFSAAEISREWNMSPSWARKTLFDARKVLAPYLLDGKAPPKSADLTLTSEERRRRIILLLNTYLDARIPEGRGSAIVERNRLKTQRPEDVRPRLHSELWQRGSYAELERALGELQSRLPEVYRAVRDAYVYRPEASDPQRFLTCEGELRLAPRLVLGKVAVGIAALTSSKLIPTYVRVPAELLI